MFSYLSPLIGAFLSPFIMVENIDVEAYSSSGVNRWCIIRSSQRLKNLIKFKIKQGNESVNQISKKIDLDHRRIYLYLKYSHSKKKRTLNQYQILKLADYLGIQVTLNIEMYDNRDTRPS